MARGFSPLCPVNATDKAQTGLIVAAITDQIKPLRLKMDNKPCMVEAQGSTFAAGSITGSNEVSSKSSWSLLISRATPLYLPFLP